MKSDINTGHCARSFIIGVIILIFSTSLVACGPGPEESAASWGASFAHREPTPEFAPTESEIGLLTSAQ